MGNNNDFYVQIDQSACDKVLDSTSYPLTAFEHRQSFPGCARLAAIDGNDMYAYTQEEIAELIKSSALHVKDGGSGEDSDVYSQVYSFASSIVQQAKKVLDALNGAPKAGPQAYEGPSKEVLEAIVSGGVEQLATTIKPLGDFGVYAWNPYLAVSVRERPEITLNSPRTDLSNVKIRVTATGELWIKYPWLDCYRWCTDWKKVVKCDRIASVTVAPEIKAKLHADFRANGARVYAQASFDELRLNYPILDKIPLEGIANKALGDSLVYVYDASTLMATVPVFQSKFAIASIQLPAAGGSLGVGVTIKKL